MQKNETKDVSILRSVISANSNEFLDILYKTLETHPIVINACMSRCGGCANDTFVQNTEELDTLRKDERYVWRPQNRLIVCLNPKILFLGEVTYKDLAKKGFSGDCLVGYGQRPMNLIYLEELIEMDERENLDDLPSTVCFNVIEGIKWHEMKTFAYVPLVTGNLVVGAY